MCKGVEKQRRVSFFDMTTVIFGRNFQKTACTRRKIYCIITIQTDKNAVKIKRGYYYENEISFKHDDGTGNVRVGSNVFKL